MDVRLEWCAISAEVYALIFCEFERHMSPVADEDFLMTPAELEIGDQSGAYDPWG